MKSLASVEGEIWGSHRNENHKIALSQSEASLETLSPHRNENPTEVNFLILTFSCG